eukprot:6490793-Amphidinium_carterae.1
MLCEVTSSKSKRSVREFHPFLWTSAARRWAWCSLAVCGGMTAHSEGVVGGGVARGTGPDEATTRDKPLAGAGPLPTGGVTRSPSSSSADSMASLVASSSVLATSLSTAIGSSLSIPPLKWGVLMKGSIRRFGGGGTKEPPASPGLAFASTV